MRSGRGTPGTSEMSEVESAAETVAQAMRALDAHRHETAPTLEREYLRALEAYFVVAERAAGREVEGEREDGSDDEVAITLAGEDLRASDLRADRASIAGHYAAARRALRLARAYRMEPGTSGRRERESVAAALRHREAVRALRLRMQPVAEQLALPGLAKTRPAVQEEGRIVRSA
jgi:hypothetical protein